MRDYGVNRIRRVQELEAEVQQAEQWFADLRESTTREVDRLRAEAIRYRDERDDAEGEAQNLGALLDGARRELASYGEPETEYGCEHRYATSMGHPGYIAVQGADQTETHQCIVRRTPWTPVTEESP